MTSMTQTQSVQATDPTAAARQLLAGLLSDARALADAGIASEADIDVAMRLGAGHPAGPFEILGRRAPRRPVRDPRGRCVQLGSRRAGRGGPDSGPGQHQRHRCTVVRPGRAGRHRPDGVRYRRGGGAVGAAGAGAGPK